MDVQDLMRIEEFRQLKKEVRGSERHLIVGIDVAKDKHNAFFGTATGVTLLKRLVFENDGDGFEKVVFGFEPTANYHKPLGEYLVERDFCVVIVSGKAVKKFVTILADLGY